MEVDPQRGQLLMDIGQVSPEIIIPDGYDLNVVIILFRIPDLLINRTVGC